MRETPAQRYETGSEGTTGDVEFHAHNPKVAGSNPAPATNENGKLKARNPKGFRAFVVLWATPACRAWAFPNQLTTHYDVCSPEN